MVTVDEGRGVIRDCVEIKNSYRLKTFFHLELFIFTSFVLQVDVDVGVSSPVTHYVNRPFETTDLFNDLYH